MIMRTFLVGAMLGEGSLKICMEDERVFMRNEMSEGVVVGIWSTFGARMRKVICCAAAGLSR